ncbi:ras-related protein Rab-37-like isoform X3 [Amphibalanus amphitrite]|uniref:ras-related protein Rab-37-like isoform X3 n=1 Tax=Amphibalanus amphitrite TaxID=1232801 RepID=UPI001C904CCC|nr:ras-related protein Rab-37-like isoform X3 [Amphibalanus amphitrite]
MTRRIETEDSLLDDDVFEPEQCVGSPPGGASSAQSRSERTSSGTSSGGHDGKTRPTGVRISVGSEVEDVIHKTILVGDSGVGKTSLLVQFDTGKFTQEGFAATVGIGFMVMLLGDTGVGKTCMMIKFKDGHFLSGTYISTVGIDYRNKVVEVDGAKVKLQVWDTAGQERFRSVTHAYYRDAHALLLLYDVTNKTSFENTRAWLAEIREYAQDNVVIMLLGNKCDRSEDRVVQSDDGERLAREFNVVFMETSAKTGMNVELAFSAIARDLLHRRLYPNGGTFNVKQFVEARSEHSPACACAT